MTEPYALGREPTAPVLPGKVVVREREDQVFDTLAAELFLHAVECVRTFGDFHLAIGAGRFQEQLCRRLMIDPAVRALPWKRTHVWASAEGAGGRGFMEIVDLLADHAGIPDSNVHIPVFAEGDPAEQYQDRLRRTLAWREKGQDRLDMVVLALRSDGRLSGLEPAWTGREADDLIAPIDGAEATGGLTMTPRLVNASRFIAIGATGREVRPAVEAAAASGGIGCGGAIRPIAGVLRWYLDPEACPA